MSKHEKEAILKIWKKAKKENIDRLANEDESLQHKKKWNQEKIQAQNDEIRATNAAKDWIYKNKLVKNDIHSMKTNMAIFKNTNTYINIEELINGICGTIKETTKEKHKYNGRMEQIIEARKNAGKDELNPKKVLVPEKIQKLKELFIKRRFTNKQRKFTDDSEQQS